MLHWADWLVLVGTMAFIAIYGAWKSRRQRNIASFLKGDNQDKWYTVGLSVMATQASAITFLSATGQGFESGMGFVQFYFGLPLAIILICAVFIPIYYRLSVFTAYEYLEQRFDLKTRLFTAALFLISRAFAAGITIYAPSIILSSLFHWDLSLTNIVMGLIVIFYTVSGGSKAVSITQKQQMAVIFIGMFIAFWLILEKLPENVDFTSAWNLASLSGKTQLVDYSFNANTRYTIWAGLLGGFFLSLSYFGTDQSQVQRYITAQDTTQSRMGLIFNAILKIPMQFFILITGVMVFVFYLFNSSPLYFNQEQLLRVGRNDSVIHFEKRHEILSEQLKTQALALQEGNNNEELFQAAQQKVSENRRDFKQYLKRALPEEEVKDTDYVFLDFIVRHFPAGLIGLLLAVIMSAAMSSTSGELSALSSTAVVDFYQRLIKRKVGNEVLISRFFTLVWGLLAIGFALSASLFENLIQLVNIVGSLFYGTILGVFVCGFFFPRIRGNQVFYAAIAAELLVIFVYLNTDWSFLWLNPLGCGAVVIFSHLIPGRHEKTDT